MTQNAWRACLAQLSRLACLISDSISLHDTFLLCLSLSTFASKKPISAFTFPQGSACNPSSSFKRTSSFDPARISVGSERSIALPRTFVNRYSIDQSRIDDRHVCIYVSRVFVSSHNADRPHGAVSSRCTRNNVGFDRLHALVVM